MVDITYQNLTGLPPDIATGLENINRRREIQNALIAQTLQQPQTQMTGGPYSRAVPYSPLQGATSLVQSALLNRQARKSDEELRNLGQQYQSGSDEAVRNTMAQASGAVPWREADPYAAGLQATGSPYPAAQRVGKELLRRQRSMGQSARPTGSTEGYFVMDNGQPKMVMSPITGEPLMPSYADIETRGQFVESGERGKGRAQLDYRPPLEAAVTAAEQGVATPLTPAQKSVDTEFAKEYADYVAKGGYADIEKGLNQLRTAADKLKEGKENLSGPIMSAQPEWFFKRTFPEAAATRDAVAEVVQRNLRLILGGQFAEREGVMLLARAYDVALPESENLKRVNRLIIAIEKAGKAKEDSIRYYEKNGTLQGFKGKVYTMQDFMDAVGPQDNDELFNEADRIIGQ